MVKRCFLKGHLDPIWSSFYNEERFWDACTFVRNKGEGGHTQREWRRRKISLRYLHRHIARRLHSLPVVDRKWNQHALVFHQSMVRVQVVGIDVTVAWMLSRVFPTIRRGRRFVSYYTTGRSREYSKTTCCCRQHKKNSAPPVFSI